MSDQDAALVAAFRARVAAAAGTGEGLLATSQPPFLPARTSALSVPPAPSLNTLQQRLAALIDTKTFEAGKEAPPSQSLTNGGSGLLSLNVSGAGGGLNSSNLSGGSTLPPEFTAADAEVESLILEEKTIEVESKKPEDLKVTSAWEDEDEIVRHVRVARDWDRRLVIREAPAPLLEDRGEVRRIARRAALAALVADVKARVESGNKKVGLLGATDGEKDVKKKKKAAVGGKKKKKNTKKGGKTAPLVVNVVGPAKKVKSAPRKTLPSASTTTTKPTKKSSAGSTGVKKTPVARKKDLGAIAVMRLERARRERARQQQS